MSKHARPNSTHRRPRSLAVLLALSVAPLLASCGDDEGVSFPSLDAATIAMYCIRGQVTPPATPSGTLANTDCHDVGDSYWEVFRVRVASAGTVTFEADAEFDSWLELVQINDLNDIDGSAFLIDQDDDSAGNFQAVVSGNLQPGVEYVIVISGYDETELGNYRILIS